ncbi:hypothetical protein PPERSA_11951 [Pseudocohnilembus persalinus]|uniref:Uncharacterized protein n=1 Tax=Pseudocohnilembus persalinus TaxID=266149 RepID=A0A0V0QJX5_PSEPJ|nr:hypothetical protein PPERSA_11951 [Pseudocohnilembus persalinus]|eukprot:KRX02611.1 hypothetical protein PPERSA_11951 [Pseudocohnilembus persalinus]
MKNNSLIQQVLEDQNLNKNDVKNFELQNYQTKNNDKEVYNIKQNFSYENNLASRVQTANSRFRSHTHINDLKSSGIQSNFITSNNKTINRFYPSSSKSNQRNRGSICEISQTYLNNSMNNQTHRKVFCGKKNSGASLHHSYIQNSALQSKYIQKNNFYDLQKKDIDISYVQETLKQQKKAILSKEKKLTYKQTNYKHELEQLKVKLNQLDEDNKKL